MDAVQHPHQENASAGSVSGSRSATAGSARGGLAGWQVRRLHELAEADLRGVTVKNLAAAVRLSPFHFVRTFHATMGTTPGQWLIGLRHARAKALLDDTELSVGEVARRVGYVGAPQLTRAFRQLTGLTPSDYRRR